MPLTVPLTRPLKTGSRGAQVAVAQSILRTAACRDPRSLGRIVDMLGEWGDGHGVDGIFGQGTADATNLIRNKLGIPETGEFDEQLRSILIGAGGYDGHDPAQHLACLNPPEPEPEPDPVDEWEAPTEPTGPEPPGTPRLLPGVLRIAVVNDSSAPDSLVSSWTDAVREQVDQDFSPHWGWARVRFANNPDSDEVLVVVRDQTDMPGAAGYHYYDGLEPLGFVFLSSSMPPSITLSHEVLEIIADATTNHFAMVRTTTGTEWRIHEVCDPVQRFAYQRRGHAVSDFVTRNYFGEWGETAPEYSFMGAVSKPFQIADGGYQIVFTEARGYEGVFGAGDRWAIQPSESTGGLLVARAYEAQDCVCVPAGLLASTDRFMTHHRVRSGLGL